MNSFEVKVVSKWLVQWSFVSNGLSQIQAPLPTSTWPGLPDLAPWATRIRILWVESTAPIFSDYNTSDLNSPDLRYSDHPAEIICPEPHYLTSADLSSSEQTCLSLDPLTWSAWIGLPWHDLPNSSSYIWFARSGSGNRSFGDASSTINDGEDGGMTGMGSRGGVTDIQSPRY